MKEISLLIKPASGSCNLRCRYCFYEDEMKHRAVENYGMMTPELAEIIVRRAFEEAEERVSFAFQGGEPMLAGLSFFRNFIMLEKKYMRPGIQVEHSIQTNGTQIDDAWASFFAENHFLVGVSLDGTRQLHDQFRVYPDGSGSYETVRSSLEILKKHRVHMNILCVVTGRASNYAQELYQSLKKLGIPYLQFIPCFDPLIRTVANQGLSLAPSAYGAFLCELFDLWYKDWADGHYVSIRLFDDYVHILAGMPIGSCATNGCCGQYFTIEGNGNVYPCDFFALDEWHMGNISESTFTDLVKQENACRFCKNGRGAPSACRDCKWLGLCGGGCQRDWVEDHNHHCEAFQMFFDHAIARLCQMAWMERKAYFA